MAKVPGVATRESESPILFAEISTSYSKAFQLLWSTEFEGKNPFYWDKTLILHPISHLLGVALETAIKGLLACRRQPFDKIHDLSKLIDSLNDSGLGQEMDKKLKDLAVPAELFETNPKISRLEVQKQYRSHRFHVECLNRVYGTPYATRYPVLGVHSLPDPLACHAITKVAQNVLKNERRAWTP